MCMRLLAEWVLPVFVLSDSAAVSASRSTSMATSTTSGFTCRHNTAVSEARLPHLTPDQHSSCIVVVQCMHAFAGRLVQVLTSCTRSFQNGHENLLEKGEDGGGGALLQPACADI